ncbi:MAG: hypothetical protein GY808_15955, partial [Gammaproteobacteria bacterium]|nr:hypothetical protein [Gammaproteobacteria bacterium]
MMETLTSIEQYSLPTILVILGFAFTLLANTVSVKDIAVHQGSRKFLGIIGITSIIFGLAIYALERIPNKWELLDSKDADVEYEELQNTTIKLVSSYSAYGNGDVILHTSETTPGCTNGYWLKSSDPGFSSNLDLAMQAMARKARVDVLGHPEEKWPG